MTVLHRRPAPTHGLAAHHTHTEDNTRRALGWGIAVGGVQAAVAMTFWWVEPSTIHALMVTMIAGVYIGFAVADGRTRVIAAESAVVVAFVVASAAAVTLTPWLVVLLYIAHGAKDLWQHRTNFVRGTRWWPPFCLAVDFTVAAIVATQILAGSDFHA
jgi:hypothetical protein